MHARKSIQLLTVNGGCEHWLLLLLVRLLLLLVRLLRAVLLKDIPVHSHRQERPFARFTITAIIHLLCMRT